MVRRVPQPHQPQPQRRVTRSTTTGGQVISLSLRNKPSNNIKTNKSGRPKITPKIKDFTSNFLKFVRFFSALACLLTLIQEDIKKRREDQNQNPNNLNEDQLEGRMEMLAEALEDRGEAPSKREDRVPRNIQESQCVDTSNLLYWMKIQNFRRTQNGIEWRVNELLFLVIDWLYEKQLLSSELLTAATEWVQQGTFQELMMRTDQVRDNQQLNLISIICLEMAVLESITLVFPTPIQDNSNKDGELNLVSTKSSLSSDSLQVIDVLQRRNQLQTEELND